MKFNERLLELRKKNGWSQEELGYKLDVSRQTISKWESGQTTPELEKLRNLAKIFEISVDELISEEDLIKEEINPEKEETKSSDKKCSKVFKYIKTIFLLILFSILIIYIIIVCKRLVIIRNVEKILMETIHQYTYKNIEKYKYIEGDEVFPSNTSYFNFQRYEKDGYILEKSDIIEKTPEKSERIDYYDILDKDEWKHIKINHTNKTYYINLFDQPFKHDSSIYSTKIMEEYQKNYNIDIETLDINDLFNAMNLKIKIMNVNNETMKGYYISDIEKLYQSHTEILVDYFSKTICLEKTIYEDGTKEIITIERYRYKYDDNYVILEEIQVPDLSGYTLVEYVEE